MDKLKPLHPIKQWIKRLLDPSEIGATAVFLASEGAAAITDEEIGVTGGM
ncbi:SDR family oxidoreductase [Peribacillus sp. NPDC096540]